MFLLKNYYFSKNLDLLPWVQKNLLPSKIKESTCEREGELKIKNWRRRGTVRKRERRSEKEGDPK
jgi:hypothetical protein